MADEPTPPAALPAAVIEPCEGLSAPQLRALAAYAERLADHRQQDPGPTETQDEGESESDPPAERPDDVPPGASVTVKEINDNRYRYWQWRDGDKIKSRYIGPAGAAE